ncbi:hypothetical protein SKAU_G00145750 [Synaphobranchus kaupii]|uniref:Uncharacterized protein n=1 Tax=Synaphobranchus kaupii TaxID=118154 RepID=A0A9Q1FTI2_SYNKA|nr:hypothetical protein SKAU_G00145750 [Synaphobranchus kaupii]
MRAYRCPAFHNDGELARGSHARAAKQKTPGPVRSDIIRNSCRATRGGENNRPEATQETEGRSLCLAAGRISPHIEHAPSDHYPASFSASSVLPSASPPSRPDESRRSEKMNVEPKRLLSRHTSELRTRGAVTCSSAPPPSPS